MANLINPELTSRAADVTVSISDLVNPYLTGNQSSNDLIVLLPTIIGLLLSASTFIESMTPLLRFINIVLGAVSILFGIYLIWKRIQYRKLSVLEKRIKIEQAVSAETKEIRKEIAEGIIKRLSVEDLDDFRDRMKQTKD